MNIRAATQTTHLGRYHVVKRLAAGGMADVLLARTSGIAGFERHVVIKRIHAGLLEEPRYVKMFLDEARLAASLHHHNIVQVNDIGEENGEYFFTMEYVHGEDARTLLVDSSKREQQIPLEHVITIVMAAAAGLHHAHEQRGMDGAPLHIVHRDVSPANILIGYDGAVKVADFGIAMAAHRAEHTQSGVLKGKVAYMSPEQCNCEPVDRRSDVFSLGIVLYELATVHPCFAGDNDFMTMSAIVGGKLALPSEYRKDLPPEVEAIMLKALARDPNDRYQTADELRLALEQYAANAKLRTSSTALADYMKTQFGAKALPWQEDDGEPVMSVVEAEPRRERTPKPTLPMRPSNDGASARPSQKGLPMHPLHEALAIPGAGDADEDLSIPMASPDELVAAVPAQEPVVRAPTLPMRALDRRPAKQVVVGTRAPSRADETAAERAPTTAYGPAESDIADVPPTAHRSWLFLALHQRKLWLAGSALAVLIAAVSLIIVSIGGSKPTSRASSAPTRNHSVAPEPLERPTVAPAAAPAVETPAATPDPAAKKPARKLKKEGAKEPGKPTKKWDPDALFPQ